MVDELARQAEHLPFRCPVCYGKGLVADGFYDGTTPAWGATNPGGTEICRSCQGTGVLWHMAAAITEGRLR